MPNDGAPTATRFFTEFATKSSWTTLGSPDIETLAVSVRLWGEQLSRTGAPRIELLGGHREQGVSRVMGLDRAIARTDEALESLAEDARAAGVKMVDRTTA
jgi:hypothetical protein